MRIVIVLFLIALTAYAVIGGSGDKEVASKDASTPAVTTETATPDPEPATAGSAIETTSEGSAIMEVIGTWFAYGTIGFIATLLILIVGIGLLTDQRRIYPGWSSILLAFGAVLIFSGNPSWLATLWSYWYFTLAGLLAFAALAGLWTYAGKWKFNKWRYQRLRRAFYVQFCVQNKLLTSEQEVPASIPDKYKADFRKQLAHYVGSKRMIPEVPNFEAYKGKMWNWFAFAPFSFVMTMALDGLGNILARLIVANRKRYEKVSASGADVNDIFGSDSKDNEAPGTDAAKA